jgi:hypothetical protein
LAWKKNYRRIGEEERKGWRERREKGEQNHKQNLEREKKEESEIFWDKSK